MLCFLSVGIALVLVTPKIDLIVFNTFIRKLLSSNITVGHMFYTKFIFT